MPGGYFIGADTGRLAWPIPITVSDGSEIEARVSLSKGDGNDPDISFGLLCSPVPIMWQDGLDAGTTFVPLGLDNMSISHAGLRQYGGLAQYGAGIPAGTAQVAMAALFHNDERPFLDDFIFNDLSPALVSRVGDNTALISEEQIARSTAEEAIAARIDTLKTDVDGNTADITTEQIARSTAEEALAARIDTLKTDVDGNTADITTEQIARSTAEEALAARIDTLKTDVDGNTADITTEQIARSTAEEAIAARIDTLKTDVDGNTADITTEQIARSTAEEALAARIDTLKTDVDGNTADITTEQIARSTAEEALAARIDTLKTDVDGNTADITTEQIARSTAEEALAARIDTLKTDVDGNTADITTQVSALSTLDETIAARIDSYDSVFGENAANANAKMATIANDEISSSTIDFNTDANGAIASISLTSKSGTTTSTSLARISADQILFAAGQLLFKLTSNEAQLNKPLSIDIGTRKKLTLAPKSGIFLWKGLKTVSPANMTRANAEWYLGEENNPYINGTPHTPGTSNAAVNRRVSFPLALDTPAESLALDTIAECTGFRTSGNTMEVTARLRAQSSRLYTPPNDIVVGRNESGSVQLKIEVNTNSQGWIPLHNGGDVRGELISSWAIYDPNWVPANGDSFLHQAKEDFALIVNYSGSLTRRAGDIVQWRARAINWGSGTAMPPGHSPSGELEIFVNENG